MAVPTALLFFPPLPPVQLRPQGSVVMGRSRSCNLRLPSADASRRHAEIVGTPEGYVLRDLRSTNGTFVNGERVEERMLRPGDKIEIGGDSITFCQVEAGVERAVPTLGEEKTILIERPALAQLFQGSLSEFPTFAVLQILELGRKTGVLLLESDQGPGKLWLCAGAPVHAETKTQKGFDAAVAVVNMASGRFSFEAQREAPERTIQASVTELLLEASRIQDEAAPRQSA
jgi:pSer/pThr/pTyr-binding forkhead associated (FHA) protein